MNWFKKDYCGFWANETCYHPSNKSDKTKCVGKNNCKLILLEKQIQDKSKDKKDENNNLVFKNIKEISKATYLSDCIFQIDLPNKQVVVRYDKIDYVVKSMSNYFIVIGDNEIQINKEFYDWYAKEHE